MKTLETRNQEEMVLLNKVLGDLARNLCGPQGYAMVLTGVWKEETKEILSSRVHISHNVPQMPLAVATLEAVVSAFAPTGLDELEAYHSLLCAILTKQIATLMLKAEQAT